MQSNVYIDTAKDSAEGDSATQVGAPTESQATAKQYLADYDSAKYAEVHEAYGAYSYDAANVIIQALAKVLPKAKDVASVRPKIIAAIQGTTLSGATGAVAFDEFGDTTNKVLTVYTVKGGKWTPAYTDSFK